MLSVLPHIDALGYTCAVLNRDGGGRNETQHNEGMARRNRGRSNLDRLGLFYWHAPGASLRGHAKTGIIPAATALSALHADLDSADIRDVDSNRVPLRVGSPNRWPWTENRPQDWDDRWILRRCAGQFCASIMVSRSPTVTARLDARPVGRRNLSRASRRLLVQRAYLNLNVSSSAHPGSGSI